MVEPTSRMMAMCTFVTLLSALMHCSSSKVIPDQRYNSHRIPKCFHSQISSLSRSKLWRSKYSSELPSPIKIYQSTQTVDKEHEIWKPRDAQPTLFSLTIDELSDKLGGSGRAYTVWNLLKKGIDPNLLSFSFDSDEINLTKDSVESTIIDAWLLATTGYNLMETNDVSSKFYSDVLELGLGVKAWTKLQAVMGNYHKGDVSRHEIKVIGEKSEQQDQHSALTINESIATLSQIKVSTDGTTKLLLKMAKDGLEVESVIIPWMEKGFSTLCVSSQVGCRQGCTFCATGRMGKLRSLTTDEILVQVYYGSKVCRVVQTVTDIQKNRNANLSGRYSLPSIDNIVFMGMGEPADNAEAVVHAVHTLSDRRMFGFAQSKITISTVAPDPTAFVKLGRAPAALAWSVHAVADTLRKKLVPTTKHSMDELKAGLIQALSTRSNKLRRTMLEVVLIEGVNDSDMDAELLSAFASSIMNDVEGSKIVVNLIPFNDIGHTTYCAPPMEKLLAFQRKVMNHRMDSAQDNHILCYVRNKRGDDESAACGQLATKRF